MTAMKTTTDGFTYKYDVKKFTQKGQTCGIYALEAALKAFGITNFPARANQNRITKLCLKKLDGKDYKCYSLRKLAKLATDSKIGEIFNVNDLVQLSRRSGIQADVIKINNLKEQIKDNIDNDKLLIVPFCPGEGSADKGKPSNIVGKKDNGHWCVVFAYHDVKGLAKVVHGWGECYDFNISKLKRSNRELHKFTCSRWYKYKGNETALESYKINSDYYDYTTWKRILTNKYFNIPANNAFTNYWHGKKLNAAHVTKWLKCDKEFKSGVVPNSNLAMGLGNKMVAVWK